MQGNEFRTIEEINEDELQSITGGCGACAPDRQIATEVRDKVIRWQELKRQGAPLPADMTDEVINRDITRGNAALARIAQRHPPINQPVNQPVNPLLKRLLPMHEFM
jgi:bacteriocin-like protein